MVLVVSNGLSLGLILFQRNFVVGTSNPIQHISVPFITGGGSYRLSGNAMLNNNNRKQAGAELCKAQFQLG